MKTWLDFVETKSLCYVKTYLTTNGTGTGTLTTCGGGIMGTGSAGAGTGMWAARGSGGGPTAMCAGAEKGPVAKWYTPCTGTCLFSIAGSAMAQPTSAYYIFQSTCKCVKKV